MGLGKILDAMHAAKLPRHMNAYLAAMIALLLAPTACSAWQIYINTLKGELIGNDYVISEYDDSGNRTLQVSGDKISISAQADASGEPTSYISITIDGYEWKHVGSTLVFAQKGVNMITDFQIPDEIVTSGETSTGFMPVDKFVNSYKNLFGKELVVLVSSQDGTPIGLFQGDDCGISIPTNLPKMTLINVDGKMVYIHRADVDILPAEMLD